MRLLCLWFLLMVSASAETFWFWEGSRRVELAELSRRSPSGLVSCTFWCSQCHSCRVLEPELVKLYEELGQQVAVVAVDASFFDDEQAIARYGLPVPVLRDPRGGLSDCLRIDLTTTTVIFDGRQRLRYFGGFGSARAALLELLAGKPVSQPTTPLQGCPILRLR